MRKYSQVKVDNDTVLSAQQIKALQKRILEVYSQSDKRLGVRTLPLCLAREHCITVNEGQVYRLMKQLKLPKMSTVQWQTACRRLLPGVHRQLGTAQQLCRPAELLHAEDRGTPRLGDGWNLRRRGFDRHQHEKAVRVQPHDRGLPAGRDLLHHGRGQRS